MPLEQPEPDARHILSLSGGKDSTALAIHLHERIADLEYVFCDTEKELPETYDYLARLEAFLGKPIHYLKHDGKGFDELLMARGGYLPSPQVRWCTEYLKIKPFEKYVGDDLVYNYIGIRADEPHRRGYISTKPNIVPRYPFIDDGIRREDVYRILEESGMGVPDYYRWRSRSGCYFCFFQQRIEWVGLLENHPELYESAIKYEKADPDSGERYTWSVRESLDELREPERIMQIIAEHQKRQQQRSAREANQTLIQLFSDEPLGEEGCLICHL
jgi:3'-phosphoadenosine 5'-phosphosulfate sulfotransferase (PAPS reductase)/FAD synthetase